MTVDLNALPFNLETFICGHLAREERPIAYVIRGTDGVLSMLCGRNDDCDVEDASNCKLACLGEMIQRHHDLRKITALPLASQALWDGANGWILTHTGKENEL